MIKILFLDIDGVITDGKVCIDERGKEFKVINFIDIDAIFEAKRSGLLIGFITGESGKITEYFRERFKPDYFISGCKNKKKAIEEIIISDSLQASEICYIGDSRHDLEAIEYVGLGLATANAQDVIKKASDHVLSLSGGCGAVQEALNYILQLNKSEVVELEYELFYQVYNQNTFMMKSIVSDIVLLKKVIKTARLIVERLREGGQVFFCGNGGSAADAQHLATELISRFYLERKAFNAEALSTNTSTLTAIANDYAFDQVFARQVEAKGKPGDLLIGISTSGNSANIVEALKTASSMNLRTVALTGSFNDTKVEAFADIIIKAPATLTPRIQEAHIFIGHYICELVEVLYTKEESR